MLKFSKTNLAIAILLFLVEVFIALFINDNIIRPYIGDVLVVILLYYLVKSFFDLAHVETAIAVLLFAYCIETLQYFNIVGLLGLSHSKIANIIIGTHFSWIDILAYTLGIIIILVVENFKRTKNTRMIMS